MTLWKDYRNFTKRSCLREVSEFVIITEELFIEFSEFKKKEILRGYSFLPLTTLLKYWNENVAGTTSAVVSKFGQNIYTCIQVQLTDYANGSVIQWR